MIDGHSDFYIRTLNVFAENCLAPPMVATFERILPSCPGTLRAAHPPNKIAAHRR
jgi:hypothetical protein